MGTKKDKGGDAAIKYDRRNYRKHDERNRNLIKKSLEECGAGRSILLDKDGVIVAGNGVYSQAEALGLKVRVVETDGTEIVAVKRTDLETDSDKRRRLAVMDNSASDSSQFDAELLKEDFDRSTLADMGVELLNDEFAEAALQSEDGEAELDDDAEVERRVKDGDLWELGDHLLLVGDSTNKGDVATLVKEGGGDVDMLITDPPYNVDLGHKYSTCDAKALNRRTDGAFIKNDHFDDDEDFVKFLTNAFNAAMPCVKKGGVFYVWYASSQSLNFLTAAKNASMFVRQILVWNKSAITLGRQDFQWKHEPCLYGWKDGGSHKWYGDRKQSTVLDFDKPSKSDLHPTMKPVALFRYQISLSSAVNQTVLDIFGGSGTTIIACEELGRKARVVELDTLYADRILARWEQMTGKAARLIKNIRK